MSGTRDGTFTTLARDEDGGGESALAGACLVLLLECDRPLASSARHSLTGLDAAVIGRAEARTVTRADGLLTLGVPDARMSQIHVRLRRAGNRWQIEDANSRNGLILNGTRHDRATLEAGDVIELGHTFFLFLEGPGEGIGELPADREAADLITPAGGLATFVPALQRTLRELDRVARTPVPILILGETGSGKELLARAVHAVAGRGGPFVAVNCGALPATLVESELFGYRKGAFSGATQDRVGLVRSADGGTLFLDEIGDLTLPSQAALLRVLQEREVTPLGATVPVPVDIRLVAATHHDLRSRVARDEFRRDLYARVAGFSVRLPPLRERRQDLGILVAALLPRTGGADADRLRLGTDAFRALLAHGWPLNVRELEACLGVAAALCAGGVIKLEHLPESVRGEEPPTEQDPSQGDKPDPLSPEEVARRDELIALLREHGGNVSAVARATGKARVQIHRWLKRYRLDPDSFR